MANTHDFINEYNNKKSSDYDEILKKYQSMASTRKEYKDIDINDYLPSIADMLKEDCVWDVLKDMGKEVNNGKDEAKDIAYYTEEPPIMTPGYYEEERCFVLRASEFNTNGDKSYELGEIDGDTWSFNLDKLSTNGSFTINGKKYESYKEYAISRGLDCANLEIRTVGIDTAEICHYTVVAVYDKNNIVEIKYKDIDKTNRDNSYHFNPFKINKNNSKNPDKWIIKEYEPNEKIRFIKQDTTYFQIMEDMNAENYIDPDVEKDSTATYYVIAGAGKSWGSETIRDGYKAQYRVRELVEHKNLKDIITIIDQNTTLGRKTTPGHVYYNSFFFADKNIETLIYDFKRSVKDIPLYNLSLAPFGCDKYGRSLGNTWVLIGTEQGDMWINVAKYVMAGTKFSINNPSFSSTDMSEIYGGVSDIFKQWTNTSNEGRYVDSLDANGEQSYLDRLELHKKLTGIDFSGDARNCTILIGDSLFMLPPQSIRHNSTLDYEKAPIIRGKGSMTKSRTNIEEIIELELYFNTTHGINGIEYKTKTPNNKDIIYYMNGLRALVAQFKVSPFLPIENHYINDVLNIEAVSLVNLNASTVDGFPHLLKVVLTLRDFNYRVFMPDLPLPDYDTESEGISQMQHIFAKSFDWELFRYYYQRGIIFGEELGQKKYNSFEYGDFLYSHKNSYLPSDINSSEFEIFVPDIGWLKSALQVKKAKDQYGQFMYDTSLNETELEWMGKFGAIENLIKDGKDTTNYKDALSDIKKMGSGDDIPNLNKLLKINKKSTTIENVLSNKKTNLVYLENNSYYGAYDYIEKLIKPIYDSLRKSPIIKTINIDEITKDKKVVYNFTCYLNFTDIDNLTNIKTVLKDYVGADNTEEIFGDDGTINLNLTLDFKALQTAGSENIFYGQHFTGVVNDSLSNAYVSGANSAYKTNGEDNNGVQDMQDMAFSFYNYKEPQNMKFVPYVTDSNGDSVPFELTGISFSMGNVFTETHLKAVDGYAPQFMGGTDVSIEMNMTVTSEYYIGVLKGLPHLAMDMIRNYRRVMPCFPIKIKNNYLQMIGVNECLIENVMIDTKEGYPGTYDVVIRMTSVDRSARQREALTKTSSGSSQTSTSAGQTIANYFELQQTLASAELYPDLDLPKVSELADLGWKFAKWANEDRKYVDPDFYVCYSFQYAAKLVKEIINKVLNKISYNVGVIENKAKEENRKLNPDEKKKKKDASELNKMTMIDQLGMGVVIEGGAENNGINIIDGKLGFSAMYDNIMSDIQSSSEEDDSKKKTQKEKKEKVENLKVVGSALEYLTASGIENGWQVNPGWFAPICSDYIEKEMKKYKYSGINQTTEVNEDANEFVSEIYDLRHRALMYINRLLDKPLKITDDRINGGEGGLAEQSNMEFRLLDKAVDTFFEDSDAKALLALLNPMNATADDMKGKLLKIDSESYWQEPNMIQYIKGFLYALACTRSGSEVFGVTKTNSWKPKQFQDYEYNDNDDEAKKAGKKGKKIPNNRIEGNKGGGDLPLAETYKSWYEDGVSFGAGQITRYPKSEIKKMLQPKSKIKYFNKRYKGGAAEYYNNMYYKTKKAGRKRFCETGFIDQYYNFVGYNSKEGKDYIELISNSEAANYEALLREVLMHLKRMIMEGYFFSEIDVVSQDWETVANEILDSYVVVENEKDEEKDKSNENFFEKVWNTIVDDFNSDFGNGGDKGDDTPLLDAEKEISKAGPAGYQDAVNNYKEVIDNLTLNETGLTPELVESMKKEIPKTYSKLFCSRLIYPFLSAATDANTEFYRLMEERNYDTLNTYTLASTIGNSNNSKMNKFLNALYGIKMVGSSDLMDSDEITSNTQKTFNTLMSEAFTAMSNDPRCYVLHSMYDMCVTDKRGRLLRAFPCYHMLFVDEGRMIGTWKLFDNFYNMSSLNNIEVVKSRKIPADTCTFTMSNMFMSYTDTYDNSIYQQYVNAYSVKDVFSSIFSPRGYVEKEDMIRQRKQLMDTQPLSPGVRLHVRMGYGSDASVLPIVFNGKVAEVSCGETVDIVAQGDGHELNNPLNTLGDLTARNFEESQSWCTVFKDIRGALARGGETPRNLLAKITTAQYGGAFKTIIREQTEGRFFYDNPFGLYHFGDRRFKDIFEDSEIVQNMYEVSDKTILNGTNDLLGDISTVKSAPIINCTIQDKTLWEIGHLCANSGDDYYFATRDFGLRSTLCLCQSNHYYAYAYKNNKVNGTVFEKRKPFQQYHYYDSYNDIIYNSIKASESNMKTNAVGVWEGSDWLWGTGQQSVGPIYLDMNIYPEYQKSMTVETGLISGGDGGINIPLFSALSEKFNMDEYAGRVNKSLAEKVTTNVLRQSVKDMYEGEICVIGDTSLKPYDRATIMDIYEDVSGDVEIETVIHSMNMETGFTTTFIPDLIVRAENSAQECGTQNILSSVILGFAGAITLRGAVLSSAARTGDGLVKLGKLTKLVKAGETIQKVEQATAIGKFIAEAKKASMAGAITEGAGFAGVKAAMLNPVGITATVIAGTSVFMLAANVKEMFTRWCRNIQALTVFPITKNGRLMIAGMAGHKGSVYGYGYDSSKPGSNPKDSIQSYLMEFLEGDTDTFTGQAVQAVFSFFLTDDNYEATKNKWINNLNLTNSNDIINNNGANVRKNQEAFFQSLTEEVSKEYSSRAVALAALKTKPRIRSFNTTNRTSEVYLKYQIGGIHDKKEEGKYSKYINANELSSNERVKTLLAIEDEPEIKLALNEGVHSNIKIFKLAHSKSNATFNLKMEHENTVIRYIIDKTEDGIIFDLPMLHEDAITVLKLIMNEDSMQDKDLELLNATRVNSTNSWQSTGFAFSLTSTDIVALETAISNVKKDSSWVNKEKNAIFNYKNNGKSIAITVYAPIS